MSIALIISQNVKLESLNVLRVKNQIKEKIVIVSTQQLFSNEKQAIEESLGKCYYYTFASLLSDEEMKWCDYYAFELMEAKKRDLYVLNDYYNQIKKIKNEMVYKNLLQREKISEGFLCSNDLGIDEKVWVKHGFKKYELEYYYFERKDSILTMPKRAIKRIAPLLKLYRRIHFKQSDEVFCSSFDGKKLVFIGNMNKILYRLCGEWKKSEEDYLNLKEKKYELSNKCQYLSTLHEWTKCQIPDDPKFDVRFIQDGYLPPNYTSYYLKFVPKNVKYYAWDYVGLQLFKNQGIEASILPFRKKKYMPFPEFKPIQKVLIVTSGAGDWTAIKNRSDEDLMVEAFGRIAAMFPNIEFVYRCHPLWIHPTHQGVNSINRVSQYFESLDLSNIRTSSNIIKQDLSDFKLSLPRQSMDADLLGTNLVIGEHSIAMVDGGFKQIPFVSLNLTGRRNLFCGISDLGFPHFESVELLVDFIKAIPYDRALQESYKLAVVRYNEMTDKE